MFNVCVLASDSSGNAFYVEGGSTKLLFDIGISCRKVEQRMARIGREIKDINGIFVSHEHRDHVVGIGSINRKYMIPLYFNEKTYSQSASILGHVAPLNLFCTGDIVDVGDLSVETFAKSHDAADPIGFIVHFRGKRLGIITDAGCYTPDLVERMKMLDSVVLESNHDIELLRQGQYPFYLKQRIAGHQGHISNEDCAKLIVEGASPKMQHIILAHLSENNNTPKIAYECARSALAVREDLGHTRLYMSSKDEPTELLNIRLD